MYICINIFQLSVILKMTTSPYPIIKRRKEEKYFIDESSNKPCLFPNLDEAASLDLSVVVPAYNEEQRCKISSF